MKTNAEWRLWGKFDPLFGVASWEGRERSGARPWMNEEFYALGDDWLDFEDHWKRYGLSSDGTVNGAVLEIGCGAGRITNRLARSFREVIASDVSEDMLAYARQHVKADNIRWEHSDGVRLPADDGSVDAVFSCHVFQHFPDNAAQLHAFRETFRVLRPGGSFMVHLPVHQHPGISWIINKWNAASYKAYNAALNARAVVKRALMRYGGRPYVHNISYEIRTLHRDLKSLGFQRVELSIFPVRTNGDLHPCVMGTKP